MTVYAPDDERRDEPGVEIEEFFDLPILDPEQVVHSGDPDREVEDE